MTAEVTVGSPTYFNFNSRFLNKEHFCTLLKFCLKSGKFESGHHNRICSGGKYLGMKTKIQANHGRK
jgi:hypothetical protein